MSQCLEPQTKRIRAKVGDYIQYSYQKGALSRPITTRAIIEVCDGGAEFVVEGFYLVKAREVLTVIPLHQQGDDDVF